MCIVAHETHLSDTKILAAVCGSEKGVSTRQLVVYQNQAQAPAKATSDNFMCLPVPLKDGLVPQEHISLYNFSSEGKSAKLQDSYKKLFDNLQEQFEEPPSNRSFSTDSLSSSGSRSAHLAVVQVGGYKCSLARTPDDVLNADPAVFGKPEGLNKVLQAHYPHNFAFLLCAFKQENGEKKEFHPILYTHPISQDGKLFIPTRHFHGTGDAKATIAMDWDHKIYVFGGKKEEIEQNAKKSKVGNALRVYKALNPRSALEHVTEAINDAFKESPTKDALNVHESFGTNAFKAEVHGMFDNLDFQPTAILNKA